MTTAGVAGAQVLTNLENLGKQLYFDKNLSSPKGMACATCHGAVDGFCDPDAYLPTSQGALRTLYGGRNSPTAAYAAFSPPFQLVDPVALTYAGGQFWDGRASSLADQAMGPFLNPVEMRNPDVATVIRKIKNSNYKALFETVYGAGALDNADPNIPYRQAADAIAAYEASTEVCKFTSKYDFFLNGLTTLTKLESDGLAAFNGKGNCAACHPSTALDNKPLFTDFTYDNLGVPKNPRNPFYKMPAKFNPDGAAFIDNGLGGRADLPAADQAANLGKFKVPTLRNIAITAPYAHNGFFTTLHQIVQFYNTRDVPGAGWPAPEVLVNLNVTELGNLGLTPYEVRAIVAFLETLTDGYVP